MVSANMLQRVMLRTHLQQPAGSGKERHQVSHQSGVLLCGGCHLWCCWRLCKCELHHALLSMSAVLVMSPSCSTACAHHCMLCFILLACIRESKQVCMVTPTQSKTVPNVNSSSTDPAKYTCAFNKVVCCSSALLQVSIVNSTWTAGHIRQLWWKWKAPTVVFPPCNTLTLQQLPIDRKLKRLYLVSVAQFRPEKNHRLQLEAFARARQAALQDPDSAGWSHPHPCHHIQWASSKSATYSAV